MHYLKMKEWNHKETIIIEIEIENIKSVIIINLFLILIIFNNGLISCIIYKIINNMFTISIIISIFILIIFYFIIYFISNIDF